MLIPSTSSAAPAASNRSPAPGRGGAGSAQLAAKATSAIGARNQNTACQP